MFTRQYNVNDVTKSANATLLQAAEVPLRHSFLANFFRSVRRKIISSYLSVAILLTTNIILNKHAGSIRFNVKWLEKKLYLCCDGWRIRINLIFAILKHKRNRKFDFFSVRSIFISLMNTKSGIFTRGSATGENTTFGVHSVKKSILHWKSQISSIYL